MSLDYRLREGQTNGDVYEELEKRYGQEAHGLVFSTCIHMAVVGISNLKGDNLRAYKQRLTEYALVERDGDAVWYNSHITTANLLEGMSTNVSPLTAAAWKKKVYEMLQERAYKRVKDTGADNAE